MILLIPKLCMLFYARVLLQSERRVRRVILNMSENNFTILYGSQTGQAKAIAEEIFEQAESYDLKAKLLCLSTTDKKFSIEKEKCVVFVVSTTGDGDPPDTVAKFWRRLRKKTLASTYLKGLHYTLLGLGDTNYTNFCNCSKNLNSRLLDLGATHFYPPGFADDAVGLEVVVEPWIDGLWPALVKELSLGRHDDATDNTCMTVTNKEKPGSQAGSTEGTNKAQVDATNENSSETVDKKMKIQNGPTQDNKISNQAEELPNVTLESKDATPSLRVFNATLIGSDLSIPILPASYLSITFTNEKRMDTSSCVWQGGVEFPGSASSLTPTKIISACKMTEDDAVKTAFCLTLDTGDVPLDYCPGDSFGIICPNSENEVNDLLDRLHYRDKADQIFTVEVTETVGNKKRVKERPNYIPQYCTIRQALTSCLEIRAVPRKAFLRVLCEYTSDAVEKRRLQELCSKEAAADYSRFIREPHVSFVDILNVFPSCKPPFERLLEHLPRLLPRPYSVACSPLDHPTQLRFVFNVVEFKQIENVRRERCGVCTGWLEKLSRQLVKKNENEESLERSLGQLSFENHPEVNVVLRNRTEFHLPQDTQCPLIMIGPGTGVAPFVGFLQQRQHLQRQASPDTKFGATWLFYGCRHKERDFLFRKELTEFERNGILTKLLVSFSRHVFDSDKTKPPRYVQDNIKIWGEQVCDLIYNSGAFIFVCGDAKNMAKNVLETFIDVLQNVKGFEHEEAKKEIWRLRQEHRYVEDVWT